MSLRRTRYSVLRGADFSSDPSLIDENRAAICENLIPDGSGYPEKRPGWRKLHEYADRIYGLHRFTANGRETLLVHSGSRLCIHGDMPTELCSDMAEAVSRSFQIDNRLVILDGSSYRVYDGETLKKPLWDDSTDSLESGGKYTDGGAYIPTTSIGGAAIYSSDQTPSSAFESVNKLTRWRKMTFCGDEWISGVSCRLRFDDAPLLEPGRALYFGSFDRFGECLSVKVFINGVSYPVACPRKGEKGSSSARLSVVGCLGHVSGEADRYYIYADTKEIWFAPRDGFDITPEVTGKDNIEVYYTADCERDGDIGGSTVITEYSGRLFVTGNPDKPNYDWHSERDDPFYFTDLSYQKFGDNTPVLGYLASGSSQAVVKADGSAGGSIFLRTEGTLDGETVFPVKQMASGIGGVSKDGFCNMYSDDLLLSKDGIFAIISYDLSNEKSTVGRSRFVDARLKAEEGLENAVLCKWGGLCLCLVGTRAYILNADAARTYNAKNESVYDCWYWTNIPADRAVCFGGSMFFSDGRFLCRMNDDLQGVQRYGDDGEPITARWGTRLDDDGDVTRAKTMIKRGCSVTVKPFSRSSAHIILRTERDFGREVKYETADVFDWTDVDFARGPCFDSTDALREILVGTKVKKYKRLQFIVENNALGEGFGIVEINKHYAFGNFIKR